MSGVLPVFMGHIPGDVNNEDYPLQRHEPAQGRECVTIFTYLLICFLLVTTYT